MTRPARLVCRLLPALAVAVFPSAAAAVQPGPLVALGDSYSSGEGAPPFVKGTAEKGENTCHRSRLAWPMLVAADAKREGVSFACSGATTAHVTTSDPSRKEPERRTAQVRRLSQVPSAAVVTVTIGGNDVGFARVLARCADLDRCDRHYQAGGEDLIGERIRDLEAQLPGVYRSIQRAAPAAGVIAVGYPRIFPRRPLWLTCAATIHARELEYLNDRTADLNAAIGRAAAVAGIRFADASDALDGHEIRCFARPWVWGLALFRGGSPVSSYSFHPKERGHRALADAVGPVVNAPREIGR